MTCYFDWLECSPEFYNFLIGGYTRAVYSDRAEIPSALCLYAGADRWCSRTDKRKTMFCGKDDMHSLYRWIHVPAYMGVKGAVLLSLLHVLDPYGCMWHRGAVYHGMPTLTIRQKNALYKLITSLSRLVSDWRMKYPER